MCLEGSFYSFSTDTGCTVEVVSSDSSSSIEQYTEIINRSGSGTAEGCVSGVTQEVYDVKVYDQSSSTLIKTFAGEMVTEHTKTTTTSTGRTISLTTTTSTCGIHYSTSTRTGKYSSKCLFQLLMAIVIWVASLILCMNELQ